MNAGPTFALEAVNTCIVDILAVISFILLITLLHMLSNCERLVDWLHFSPRSVVMATTGRTIAITSRYYSASSLAPSLQALRRLVCELHVELAAHEGLALQRDASEVGLVVGAHGDEGLAALPAEVDGDVEHLAVRGEEQVEVGAGALRAGARVEVAYVQGGRGYWFDCAHCDGGICVLVCGESEVNVLVLRE